MNCLTIRQPWAWAIFHGMPVKDIENRDWPTRVRGRVAIHAAKGLTFDEYTEGRGFILNVARAYDHKIIVPKYEAMLRGFVLGTVEIIDCVASSGSPWFMGRYGFVLVQPELFNTPQPAKGALGFWQWHH